MANLFDRKIDYYVATWTCLIALMGIIMNMTKMATLPAIFSFVGVGVAMATATYGCYMMSVGYQYSQTLPKS